jgi:hypothetical protein
VQDGHGATRVSISNPDGYFMMMRDLVIDGRLKSKYRTA